MTNETNLPATPKYKWIPRRDGAPIPEIYANYAISSWTMYDVRLRLGQLVPSGEEVHDFVVEEKAAVSFSWPQAKGLVKLLTALVASYEEANGEIRQLKLPSDPSTQPGTPTQK